jgi:putative membrane protein insertion efficiency factor
MNLPRNLLVLLLRVYQVTLSPVMSALFGPAGHCRFTPSCSQYTIEALQTHGVFKGGTLAALRLGRCHPWGGCGHDPVPGRKTSPAGGCGHEALGIVSRGRV